jgi:hypothetical protein
MALLQLGGYRDGVPQGWAVVDPDLIDELNEYRWVLMREYAARAVWNGKGRSKHNVYLHRWVMGLEPGDPRVVDHINRDVLDNRRANLRVITRGQNLQNLNPLTGKSSAYRGVKRMPTKKAPRWSAQCKVAGKLHHIGTFATEIEAAEAARVFRLQHLPFATD